MHRNLLHIPCIRHVCPAVRNRLSPFSGLCCWFSSCQVLRKHDEHSSDWHGVYDNKSEAVLKDESSGTGKLPKKQHSHGIELKPSQFMSSWIRTPVSPEPPAKKFTRKTSSEQITWDSHGSGNINANHQPLSGHDVSNTLESQSNSLLSIDAKRHTPQEINQKNEDPLYNYGLPGIGKRPPNNREVKPYQRTLKTKGEILFGLFPVLLALQEKKRECHTLYIKKNLMENARPLVAEIIKLAEELGTSINPCHVSQLDNLSQSRPHQGVCMDASQLMYTPFEHDDDHSYTGREQIEETQHHQIWVVLDSIQDPMNFGAILRSAYFLGVDKVLAAAKNSCTLSPVVSKASAGALELMPVYAVQDMVEFLQSQKQWGWQVFGTASGQDGRHLLLHNLTVTGNTIMILGNEGVGLSSELLNLCDSLVTISSGLRSLNPRLDSLNVSVATGIILHHLMSRRQKD